MQSYGFLLTSIPIRALAQSVSAPHVMIATLEPDVNRHLTVNTKTV